MELIVRKLSIASQAAMLIGFVFSILISLVFEHINFYESFVKGFFFPILGVFIFSFIVLKICDFFETYKIIKR